MFLMLYEFQNFSKENIDHYFLLLSKELKKEFGRNAEIELVVVGGAAVLLNYGFRNSTMDIDAIVASHTSIKDAVNRVGDICGLPNGWINSDFQKTKSYSPKLISHSKFYKRYNQILVVRTIAAEYLVAMKLSSLRPYKYDRSDIVGIIQTQDLGNFITKENIDNAVRELYGDWDKLPEGAKTIIDTIYADINNKELYSIIRKEETTNKELLIDFENKYNDVLKEENLDSILKKISEQKHLGNERKSVKRKLEEAQQKADDYNEHRSPKSINNEMNYLPKANYDKSKHKGETIL